MISIMFFSERKRVAQLQARLSNHRQNLRLCRRFSIWLLRRKLTTPEGIGFSFAAGYLASPAIVEGKGPQKLFPLYNFGLRQLIVLVRSLF